MNREELESKPLAELTKGGTLLLVDDNNDQAHMLGLLLKMKNKGLEVETASNLAQARKRIEDGVKDGGKPILAVVTDDGLIGEQGRQFVEAVKQGAVPGAPNDLPVLLCTGSADLTGPHIITKASREGDEVGQITRKLRHQLIQRMLARGNDAHEPEEEKMSVNDMKSYVKSLEARRNLATEMTKPPRDWRAPEFPLYIENDQEYLRSLQERERHKVVVKDLNREIKDWSKRIDEQEGGQGSGTPGGSPGNR